MPGHLFCWSQRYGQQNGENRRDRLCAALRLAINQGELHKGERLPSSRLMAEDLALSRVTVEAAYRQLESEGYLLRQTGRGTFVAIEITQKARQKLLPPPIRLSQRGARVLATGGCVDPPFPCAFAAGSPELRAFPQRLWRRITAQQQRLQGSALQRYGDPQGYLPLRVAIADYLLQSRGVQCEAQQIMVLSSSQQALQLIALLLLDNGDEVWLEEPGYPGARNAFIAAGAQLEKVSVDAQGAQLRAGQPGLVYLTPAHQYPSGVTLSLARRLAWLEFAHQAGCWLIEDDYDGEFHYHGQPMPAMQGLDRRGRVIYLGTFSKTLFPSLRLAYMAVPEGLVDALCAARSVMDGHSALLPQAVTADFIANGHFAAHLRLMRQLYQSRHQLLRELLENKLSDRIQPVMTQGGMQLPVKLLQGDAQLLARKGAAQGLLLPTFTDRQQTGWLLGFSALENREIRQAVDRLTEVIMATR